MFEYDPRDVAGASAPAWLAQIAFALTIALGLAWIVLAAVESPGSPSRARRSLAAAAAACAGLGMASSIVAVSAAHRDILTPPPPPGDSRSYWPWFEAMQRAEQAHGLVAAAALAIAALAGGAVIVHALRTDWSSPKARPITACAALFATAIVGAAGIGLLRRALAGASDLGCALAVLCQICWFEEQTTEILGGARRHVLVIAAAGSALLLGVGWWTRRRPIQQDGRGALAAGVALLVLGAASFLLTRPMARDARAPLPRPLGIERSCPSLVYGSASLPPPGDCDSCAERLFGERGPVLEISPTGALIDGSPAADAQAIEQVLAAKGAAWRARGQAGYPPPLIVAVAKDARVRDIEPAIAAAARAGVWSISILTAEPPRRAPTATAGVIELGARCCCERLRIASDGSPLSSYATWADLTSGAAQADDILYVAVDGGKPRHPKP